MIGLAVLGAWVFGPAGSAQSALTSPLGLRASHSTGVIDPQRVHQNDVVPTTAPTSPTASAPPVTDLVAEVEASGIDPGPTWSWSIGDASAKCGAIPASTGTGCTSGAAGLATTVFTGTPTLDLVAHEMANAETENYAVPSLLAQVATAEVATSWSPIDAVASCLVAHFMGFQDDAAGPWQCPARLATTVARDIR